jgi:hypothetical protein
MAISLTHYQVVDDASTADGMFLLHPPELTTQRSGLERFSAHAQLEPVTRVNWPQTFALRQLRYADYQRTPEGTVLRSCFKRKPSADSTLPENVVFERNPRVKGTLQGEVLTYATDELMIHARQHASCRFTHTSSDFAELVIDQNVVDQSAIAALIEYCAPSALIRFRRDFVDSWNDSFSFVRGKRV